jgi:hypothetical protein
MSKTFRPWKIDEPLLLPPLVLGRYPAQASADNGYCSEANLEALEARNIDGYVATGRATESRRLPPIPA